MPLSRHLGFARGAGAAVALLALLPGCVPLVAGAAGTAGGYAIAQERGLQDTANDAAIKSEISQKWDKYNFDMSRALGCDVYEGRVLITGRVPNPEWRDEAVKLAWQVNGVKEVYNEIEIGPVAGTGDDINDSWITTRLRNELTWDADVRGVNYTITTSDHVVYLIGSARSQAELDRVTGYARNIPNVRRVVSYVKIRTGAPPDSQPATAQPAGALPPAPATSSAPPPANTGGTASGASAPIEVKPLQ